MHWRVTSETGMNSVAALGVDEPLVELEEVRAPAGDVQAPVLELDRPPVELAAFVLGLELDIALGHLVALRKDEDALVVGPEQLGAVDGERAGEAPPGERGQLVRAGRVALSGRNGHSSRTTPVMPVAAATRIASSSTASGTGSLRDRKASGPVSVAPSAKRRARRVKIASSAGNAKAASSASGRTPGRGRRALRRGCFDVTAITPTSSPIPGRPHRVPCAR